MSSSYQTQLISTFQGALPYLHHLDSKCFIKHPVAIRNFLDVSNHNRLLVLDKRSEPWHCVFLNSSRSLSLNTIHKHPVTNQSSSIPSEKINSEGTSKDYWFDIGLNDLQVAVISLNWAIISLNCDFIEKWSIKAL